jgi:hypothetical protein
MVTRTHLPEVEEESLKEEAHAAEQEARMVLPGIQAIFGFQMIAIFNNRFEDLQLGERMAHVASLTLVALAVALIMAPAAYHRLAEKGQVSRRFIDLSTDFLAWAMVFLAAGISSELYIVSRLAIGNEWISGTIAIGACAVFTWLWFAFPLRRKFRHAHKPR